MTYYVAPENVWDHIDIALLRDREEWITIHDPEAVRVQLGAGQKRLSGFVNLDYPEWDAHADGFAESGWARWKIPFESSTVTEIVTQFTFDHLEPWAVVRALRECQRALKPGGVLNMVHPHYSSQLANECIMHKSRFAIDTWRNIFSERQYDHAADGDTGQPWLFDINVNFMYGITERNLVLVTQLVRRAS